MKDKRRGFKLAAMIDIGSRAIRMDVVELADGEKPVLLESLEREVDLGREVFRTGEVPPGGIALVCDIMADCRRKLDEYRTATVRASASGALCEAANAELVAELMYQAGGVAVELSDRSEECRRFAAAVRRALSAACVPTDSRVVAAHVGAWSLTLLGIEAGELRFCEVLPVGSDRLPEGLRDGELARAVADRLAGSGVRRRLTDILAGPGPVLVVAAGEGARRIAGIGDDAGEMPIFTPGEFRERAAKFPGAGTAETAGAVGFLLDVCGGDRVAVPGFTTRGSLPPQEAAEDPFFGVDLASMSSALGRRFAVDREVAERRAVVAAELWKKLRTRQPMPERIRALLDASARLYDVGNCFDGADTGERSAWMIGRLLLPGVGSAELRLIAASVRFAKSGLDTPPVDAPEVAAEHRPPLFRMAALLRTADALASGDRFSGMRLNISGGELVITPRIPATGAERAELARGAELFMRVFGLKPRLGEVSL